MIKITATAAFITACTVQVKGQDTDPAVNGNYGAPATAKYGQHVASKPFVAHVMPVSHQPYPYTSFNEDEDEDMLKLPNLGDQHCFLSGAPWTSCGRRSLTSYFLDQCMVFYFEMSRNVDGICSAPLVDNKDSSSSSGMYYGKNKDAAEASTVGRSHGYLSEKCLQKSYVSITTATVMCLAENDIRIKYIEHYAAHAAHNPIEGPMLYLKKLHAFIDQVTKCSGNTEAAASNYPNLWMVFNGENDHVSYNPNSPFILNDDGNVGYDRYLDTKSTGLESFVVNDKFLCSDINELEKSSMATTPNALKYTSLANNRHYNPELSKATCSSAALHKLQSGNMVSMEGNKHARYCNQGTTAAGTATDAEITSADMSLRSLYDSVHYVESTYSDLRRPQTIAEIAVKNAGALEQPLLDGSGIMYFCAFHACKANNNGVTDGTCFPEFDAEEDWAMNTQHADYTDMKTISDKVEWCSNNAYLTDKEISDNLLVKEFKVASQRSHICMAESTVVNFMDKIYAGWETKDDAVVWVLARKLADEKCYETSKDLCATDAELYASLKLALEGLVSTCDANATKAAAAKTAAAKKAHQAQQAKDAKAQAQARDAHKNNHEDYVKSLATDAPVPAPAATTPTPAYTAAPVATDAPVPAPAATTPTPAYTVAPVATSAPVPTTTAPPVLTTAAPVKNAYANTPVPTTATPVKNAYANTPVPTTAAPAVTAAAEVNYVPYKPLK